MRAKGIGENERGGEEGEEGNGEGRKEIGENGLNSEERREQGKRSRG